jgi:MFS transporter, DHA2 family, methylenomycin A resistance protein
LSFNFLQLTSFRLLQGISAAFLVPTSLVLINASFENKEERAKAIGIWAAIGGIAAAAGPLLGGILTSWFGWPAVFFVNVPFGIAAFLLTIKHVCPILPVVAKAALIFWDKSSELSVLQHWHLV